ncbi:hypothetical protein INT44_007746 [Umbelopsis vinacea]|uniref:Kinesin-like protein n=1 Tax=Umbelopsis vinacea TaxID=44442 RepID=A0A8H7PK01_9FUNG|nr:hypothetical protein INT44_007746 [Umbelopsis vinacea]
MSIKKTGVDEKVKVVCRVRPFLDHEAPDDSTAVEGSEIKITNQRNTNEIVSFRFSSCHGPEAKQVDIYEQDVQPMIDKVFSGMDSTIFAYGVTGSGKTHTMQGTEDEPGIIPRVAQYLFQRRLDYPKHTVKIHVSYMEIYKELVYDLLIPREGQGAGLSIREDSSRNIFVANLTDREINSLEEFDHIYTNACKNRSTASTKMNVSSSRSHAILSFQVTVAMENDEAQKDDESDTEQYALSGKINLIDLAGSEDNRRTDNGKERLAESGAINKSLFVLGQVVESINAASSRIPFRDSKMTRILQPSLGGKAQGMMIVNIAPGQSYFMDSYNSLNFATKSKTIENAPTVNTISQDEPSALSDTPKLGQALRVAVLRGKKRTRKRMSDSAVDGSAKRRLYDPFRWSSSQSGSMRENDGYDDTERTNYYSRMMKPWKRFAVGNYDPWPRIKLNDEQVAAHLESRVAVLVAEKVQDLQKSNTELNTQLEEQKQLTSNILERMQALEARL